MIFLAENQAGSQSAGDGFVVPINVILRLCARRCACWMQLLVHFCGTSRLFLLVHMRMRIVVNIMRTMLYISIACISCAIRKRWPTICFIRIALCQPLQPKQCSFSAYSFAVFSLENEKKRKINEINESLWNIGNNNNIHHMHVHCAMRACVCVCEWNRKKVKEWKKNEKKSFKIPYVSLSFTYIYMNMCVFSVCVCCLVLSE